MRARGVSISLANARILPERVGIVPINKLLWLPWMELSLGQMAGEG